MTFELIQSDYYEEIGKTNFAKDLREDNNDPEGVNDRHECPHCLYNTYSGLVGARYRALNTLSGFKVGSSGNSHIGGQRSLVGGEYIRI